MKGLGLIYITGDVHGYFGRVRRFARLHETRDEDVLIVLGDAGINFWGDKSDLKLKRQLRRMHLTLLCIHGNHEMRPETIETYHEREWRGGTVYVEDAYPSILFAKDGSIFDLDGRQTLAIGGAYSVDKQWRLMDGRHWFADEQPSAQIKERVERSLDACGWKVDTVLSHTCPYDRRPLEAFLSVVDQSTVDTSTEEWLQTIEDRLTFNRWFFGHYHHEKEFGPFRILFKSVVDYNTGKLVYSEEDDIRALADLG